MAEVREQLHLEASAETRFERQGLRLQTGAPVTAAVSSGTGVAAGFGDGVVRLFHPDKPVTAIKAHRGAVLCLAADAGSGAVFTGGDDGRFLRISSEGTHEEITSFGTRWVDCVAAGPDRFACSSGRTVHVWRARATSPKILEHPSTVGGITFDAKGRRLAVAHYGGVTLWVRGTRRWEATRLVWKGSHGAVAFSPDGRYVISAMQENALHGWRLRDRADMGMAGYPAKVKSFAWAGTAPLLATSGAEEAICWPFDGRAGPMDRSPATCAYGDGQRCTVVAGLVDFDGVLAGFADGRVLVDRPSSDRKTSGLVVQGGTGTPVTALALTPDGWLFVGEESGRVLWGRLGGDPR